jgi:dethiobiotin synthetase
MTDRTANTYGLFVTATDTGVGKTYLTALIAGSLREKGLRVGAYKPACSGAEVAPDGTLTWADIETLAAAIGGAFAAERICPLRFQAPLAPSVAARREGTVIDFARLRDGAAWWQGRVEVLLIEGIGGLLCPLTELETIADLAMVLAYPLLVVARAGLGTINHTLLTIEAAQRRGLKVAGVVLNEASGPTPPQEIEENAAEIGRRANVSVLGVVRQDSQHVEHAGGRVDAMQWLNLITKDRRGATNAAR